MATALEGTSSCADIRVGVDYYVLVHGLCQSVSEYARHHRLLRAGDRVGVAVSGGADSVALLRVLLELRKHVGIVLSVVHFNHKLRGPESDDDERFVGELAKQHKLEIRIESGEVVKYAAKEHLSLETAAREMRYRYFRQLLTEGRLNRIATGHTLDDQAETVLLKIVRGAGSRGLAGIYPHLKVPRSQLSAPSSQQRLNHEPSIIRPLLGTRRTDLEAYLVALGQAWHDDQSNRDLRHMRNRVRHGIMPRLQHYLNPGVREAFAETAEIARAEEEYWEQEVARLLPRAWKTAQPRSRDHCGDDAVPGGVLQLSAFADLPLALQRRIVRAASESLGLRLDFHHVEEILALASSQGKSAGSTMLPDGWEVSRRKAELHFESRGGTCDEADYEYCLPVPGSIEVRETHSRFETILVPGKAAEGYNPGDLLDRTLLSAELRVRNWRPGDRFWPAHTKVAKKIKELLQERHVAGSERKLWPVVLSGTDVVWVRGFPGPARLRPGNVYDTAVLLRETELNVR